MYEWITLLALGFVTFFATGVDDTIAYAGSYLNNRRKDHKLYISGGIFLGTFIALGIAIFAGSALQAIPSRHLISGAVLITIGAITLAHGEGLWHTKKIRFFRVAKRLKKSRSEDYRNIKFVGLGMLLFFTTGIDDLLAYSNLIMAKGSWFMICAGVVVGTFVSLVIAYLLADKLKKVPHPGRIGGIMIIIIGVLLALKVL